MRNGQFFFIFRRLKDVDYKFSNLVIRLSLTRSYNWISRSFNMKAKQRTIVGKLPILFVISFLLYC